MPCFTRGHGLYVSELELGNPWETIKKQELRTSPSVARVSHRRDQSERVERELEVLIALSYSRIFGGRKRAGDKPRLFDLGGCRAMKHKRSTYYGDHKRRAALPHVQAHIVPFGACVVPPVCLIWALIKL